MDKQFATVLAVLSALSLISACSTTEEAQNPNYSMRYEICKPASAGPNECPKTFSDEFFDDF